LFKIIVITPSDTFENETKVWVDLFEAGLERLHVRKPGFSVTGIQELLQQVPVQYYSRMVLSHQPELVQSYGTMGLHLSYVDFKQYSGTLEKGQTLSVSVHNWSEAAEVAPEVDYVFISPVFDSISKSGYLANESLRLVPAGLNNIYALGGVCSSNIDQLSAMGYVGGVVLGEIWNKETHALDNFKNLINKELIE